MKNVANIALIAGGISFILGLISRLTMRPLPIIPGGVEAQALLAFTNTCLLVAVVVILQELIKK